MTYRDFVFITLGIAIGPLLAIGIIIGAITWMTPMGTAWIRFPNENWHHVMIQLTPWPKLMIDGDFRSIQAAEIFVMPNGRGL